MSICPTGGFLVKVEVYKFLEDMPKPDRSWLVPVFNNDFPHQPGSRNCRDCPWGTQIPPDETCNPSRQSSPAFETYFFCYSNR